ATPPACAAALAVCDVCAEEHSPYRSHQLGQKLNKRFSQRQDQFTHVDNVRNLGAMAAFELVESKESRKPMPELVAAITKKAKEKGLILLSCGMYANTLRFLMPVTIEEAVLEEGLAIVEECLKEAGA